jgi:DNA-directed RNA polymerase specialized sigma24 family protein
MEQINAEEESAWLALHGPAVMASHESIQARIDQGFAVLEQLFQEGRDGEAYALWNAGILEGDAIMIKQAPLTPYSEDDHSESIQELLRCPVQELAARLAKETKKFLADKTHNDQPGLALFTLAITQNNQEAWTSLYEQYRPLVLNWLMRSPQAKRLIAYEGDATSLIDSAFTKFFQSVPPSKIGQFQTLAGLLRYLQRCTYSVVVDLARTKQARCDDPLDEVEHDSAIDGPESAVLTGIESQRLWQLIEEVTSETEYWLLHQTFVEGARPKEVSQDAPAAFPTVEDVYRVRKNVLERLRRNRKLQQEFGYSGLCGVLEGKPS